MQRNLFKLIIGKRYTSAENIIQQRILILTYFYLFLMVLFAIVLLIFYGYQSVSLYEIYVIGVLTVTTPILYFFSRQGFSEIPKAALLIKFIMLAIVFNVIPGKLPEKLAIFIIPVLISVIFYRSIISILTFLLSLILLLLIGLMQYSLISLLLNALGIYLFISGIFAAYLYSTFIQKNEEIASILESEGNSRNMIENLPLGVAIGDLNGFIKDANPSFCDLLGYSLDEIKTLHVTEYTHPGDVMLLNYQPKQKIVVKTKKRYIRKSGETVTVYITAIPILKSNEEYWLILTQNLSEIELLNEQIIRAEKFSVLGQMSGMVAHDINNLLLVIRGNAELIEMQTDSEQIKHFSNEILKAVDNASITTRELLGLSKHDPPKSDKFTLNDVIGEMRSLLRFSAGKNKLTFDINSQKAIEGNKELFKNVLLNLVVNAKEAILHESGVININVEDEENGIIVKVRDNGVGIPLKYQNQIFEPFMTDKPKNTGLGLASVKNILEKFSGSITFETKENEGTVFKIFIPSYDSLKDVVLEQTKVVELPGNETIMILDDNKDICNFIEIILKNAGYNVLAFTDPRKALVNINNNIDLIITDVFMPDIDGITFAKKVRNYQDIPILFMSGYSESGVDVHNMKNTDFLEKPFNKKQLYEMIRKLLSS
jgi:PAS domain S-box-containing protein